MADVKPLKLVDQGGGVARLAEFAAGDRLPSDAVPEKLQALADASWAANQVPYFTGANTVDKFALSAVSRGILAAGLGNAANATLTNLPSIAVVSNSRSALTITTTHAAPFLLNRTSALGNISIEFRTTAQSRFLGMDSSGTLKVGISEDMTAGTSYTLWNQQNSPKAVNGIAAANGDLWVQSVNGMYGFGGGGIARDSGNDAVFRPTESFYTPNTNNVYGLIGAGIHLKYTNINRAVEFFGTTSGASPRFFGRASSTTDGWILPVEFWTSINLTPNVLASYTLATLPNAAANPRLQAWCSNLTGGAMPVYSDGTNWRRVFDNSIAN